MQQECLTKSMAFNNSGAVNNSSQQMQMAVMQFKGKAISDDEQVTKTHYSIVKNVM